MRSRLVILVAVLAVLLAACGGGGGGDKGKDAKATGTSSSTTSLTSAGDAKTTSTTAKKGAAGATTTTAAKTTGPTAAPSPADAARIDPLVLLASDFPAGWKSTPTPPETADEQSASRQLNKCLGASGPEAETAHKYGDTFSQEDATQASAEATTVKDDATYQSDVAAVRGPKLTPCLKEAFGANLKGATGGAGTFDVQVSDLAVKSYGDLTVGRRVTINAKGPSGSAKIYVDVVIFAKNRAEVSASFLHAGSPFDANLETALIDKLGTRINAA